MPGRHKRERAMAKLAAAEQLYNELRTPQLEGYLALGKGVVAMQVGELDRAQEHLDQAETIFGRCPGLYWETGTAREFALWALSYRGRLPELTQRLAAAVDSCTARGDRLGRFKLLAGPSRLALLARDTTSELLDACDLHALALDPDDYPFLAFCAVFG